MRRAWLALAAAWLIAAAPAAPDWAAAVTDMFAGREWNAGVMACARTEFSLRDGALVGHYWIGDNKDPFEGDLTGFVPAADHSGTFIWTDRYGQGVLFVRFAEDGARFDSWWGEDVPQPDRPGYGRRGADAAVPGCDTPTS